MDLPTLRKTLYDVAMYFVLYAWATDEDIIIKDFVAKVKGLKTDSRLLHQYVFYAQSLDFGK